jgi:hypothetical protein
MYVSRYRVWSWYTVRAIDGQGALRTSTPSTLSPSSSSPDTGSRIAGSIPKNGTVAEPGFVSIAPGNGVTTIEPVSVCQKVSTMAH